MKRPNNLSKMQEVAKFLGGTFKKIGQSRYRGGRLVALEGSNGKTAFANFKTIFQKGKPVGAKIVGWAPA